MLNLGIIGEKIKHFFSLMYFEKLQRILFNNCRQIFNSNMEIAHNLGTQISTVIRNLFKEKMCKLYYI